MRPGIRAVEGDIITAMRAAALAELRNDSQAAMSALKRAGATAMDGIIEEIGSGPLDPGTRTLSDVTLRLRKQGRGKDRPPRDSTEPLVDVGSMRQSITFVVDK